MPPEVATGRVVVVVGGRVVVVGGEVVVVGAGDAEDYRGPMRLASWWVAKSSVVEVLDVEVVGTCAGTVVEERWRRGALSPPRRRWRWWPRSPPRQRSGSAPQAGVGARLVSGESD